MSPLAISLTAFASIFSGALLGMSLRRLLPKHHLSSDSQDVMKLGIGMIATMAALVLGLLISSAKGTFDTMDNELIHTGAKIILLDRTMARYGPETREARDILRSTVTSTIARTWPEERDAITGEKVGQRRMGIEDVEENIRQLSPRNSAQSWLQWRAIQIGGEISEARWLLIQQAGHGSLPMPFVVLLICWLALIFAGFGLFTARNTTVIVVLFICALSAASSIFLILELDQPYGGLIRVSSAPLLNALAHLGR